MTITNSFQYLINKLSPPPPPDTNDYVGNDFRWTFIQRALSQPLFTIPLSALAIRKILPSMASAASSSINMIRNLGGSVGISLVSNIINNHTSFYVGILEIQINPIAPTLSERMAIFRNLLFLDGLDPTLADEVSRKVTSSTILRESYFHCFNEVFEFLTIGLLIACALVLFIPKEQSKIISNSIEFH